MRKHIANKRQQKAFERVVKAFQSAKKTGLVFYAKQDNIVAYTEQADNYMDQWDFEVLLRAEAHQIPSLSNNNCIQDSGADDYACYMTSKDEQRFNPDRL